MQRYHLLTKKHYDLCEEKWYRAYLGGLWSKAEIGIEYSLLVHVELNGEPFKATVAEPFLRLSDDFHGWVQAPVGTTDCIHDNLKGWLVATQGEFPDNYNKFTEMSMVYQRFNRSTSLVCDCEKYLHRRSE